MTQTLSITFYDEEKKGDFRRLRVKEFPYFDRIERIEKRWGMKFLAFNISSIGEIF